MIRSGAHKGFKTRGAPMLLSTLIRYSLHHRRLLTSANIMEEAHMEGILHMQIKRSP